MSTPDRIVLNILPAGLFGDGMTYELRSTGKLGADPKTYTVFRQPLDRRAYGHDDIIPIDDECSHDSTSVECSQLEVLLERIKSLHVPLLVKGEQGFDGTYYHLGVYEGAGYVSVYSWCVPAKEIAEIHDFQNLLIETIDTLLDK